MGNDLVPSEGGISWTELLDKFNIPKIVAGPAGEAFSRLVGKAMDIPAAKLDQISQGIKDKTAAKTLVSKTLSEEVAKSIVADQDLVQRAADNFLAKELRKQSNKDAIAEKTIEILAIENKSEETHASQESHLDQDWLNIFEQYAENASSERVRDLWSRTLAGEIRKPKSFSLQTLRFISELDRETASLFEKHSDAIVNGDFIPHLQKYNSPPFFADFLALESAGLLSGASGTFHKTFDGQLFWPLQLPNAILIARGNGPYSVRVPALILSKIGKEVATLSRVDASIERTKDFVGEMPKTNFTTIIFQRTGAKSTEPSEMLWQAAPKEI